MISSLFITVSLILQDPLSLKSPFPWIWFSPVLIALRYGLYTSQLSILLLLSSYLYSDQTPLFNIHFQLFILGGFLLTIVCVMFQNNWLRRIKDSNGISSYLQKRIQTIAYAYKVTLLAYQRLEQSYIVKPVTIRSSLGELREMQANNNNYLQKEIVERFLNIVALHCSLEIAGIFSVKYNQINSKPIVAIGKMKSPKKNDFLIQECIKISSITYVKANNMAKGRVSDFLIVAPFINQEDEIYALLIVEAMPFLSLNDENIETINLLLQYFLEGNTVKNAELMLKQYPDSSVLFANELQRLMNLQKNTKQDSAMVAFFFLPHPHQDDYLFRLKQEKRGLDSFWETTQGNNKILLLLMPITPRAGIESYRIRINNLLEREFQIVLNQNEIKFKTSQLSSFNNPIHLIQDLLTIK